MRWLKSTTQKSWVLSANSKQFVVPANVTQDGRWLVMEETDFAEVVKQPVVKSLVTSGAITVLDKEPAEIRNSVPNLQVENTTLKAELDTVKAERDSLKQRVQDLEKGTVGVDLEAEIAKAVEATKAEYEQKLKDLDDKASNIIAEKDQSISDLTTEVEKLKKKLKKADQE
jgi:chromosome segregation ATPase